MNQVEEMNFWKGKEHDASIKLATARKALEFYADGYEEITHENNGKFYPEIIAKDNVLFDEGKIAKEALDLIKS